MPPLSGKQGGRHAKYSALFCWSGKEPSPEMAPSLGLERSYFRVAEILYSYDANSGPA